MSAALSRPSGGSSNADRRHALAEGLTRIRTRIDAACRSAGRDPAEVHLIVVTKTWPTEDVLALADLGVTDVGENKAGELRDKRRACAESVEAGALTWHFIGQIQSNKAREIARNADVVHAVDRPKLLAGLGHGATERAAPLACLVQVSLDPEPIAGRGGAHPDEVLALADQIVETAGLDLRGVMGVAPLGGDPQAAFAVLREVADRVVAAYPRSTWMSAGMSGDLEQAVAAGATHLRVGSAILGSRPPLG